MTKNDKPATETTSTDVGATEAKPNRASRRKAAATAKTTTPQEAATNQGTESTDTSKSGDTAQAGATSATESAEKTGDTAQGQASKTPTTIAEATQNATFAENPASTTRADDPNRDATVTTETTAERQVGATTGTLTTDTPDNPDAPMQGNRHSHPAQTTAEATLDALNASNAEGTANGAIAMGGGLPAAEAADPANQPSPSEGRTLESRHDESGTLQDATREALGSGTGAPDGNMGSGKDPSERDALLAPEPGEATVPTGGLPVDKATANEEVEPVELKNGEVLKGGRAKLFRALEAGATQKEMLDATGWNSVLGSVNTLARRSGRELEVSKDKKTGEKTYKLKPSA